MLPIRKIDFNRVVLSSAYGKLFITKADGKNKDFGYWLSKELSLMGTEEYGAVVKNLISRVSLVYDKVLPTDYTVFSRYTKSFTFKENWKLEFHYPSRLGLLDGDNPLKELERLEKDKYVIIGRNEKTKEFVLMDKDNEVYIYRGTSYIKQGKIFDFLNINITNSPNESLIIKVFKKKLPLVLLMSYYVGLSNLLKMLNVDYKFVNKRERYDKNKFVGISFKDKKLLVSKNNHSHSLLFAGFELIEKNLRDIDFKLLNKKSTFSLLFSNLDLDKTYINEFDLINSMFIDPVTKTVLEQIKMPNTFMGLIIKSSEMLADDAYKNPVNNTELIIKSSDRLVSFMYNELVKSTRVYKNKEDFNRTAFTIDPYSVWRVIGDDSTSTLVKTLNPVDSLKQIEEVTKIGQGGMNKESVTKAARAYHPTAIGIISEATKDSGAVGISAYLSATPNINNVLGIQTEEIQNGISSMLSTSALLSPFVEYEASKRAGFISIQNGHVAPLENAEIPYIRTLEEMTIAYRVGKEFAFMAKADGKVIKLTKNQIEIEYVDGTKDSAAIGSWSTRPESGKAFKNIVVTDLREGSTFKNGEAIAWNQAFFQKDFLFKNKLIFKMALYANVALSEEKETNEDSSIVSSSMYSKLVTQVYSTQDFIFKNTDDIIDVPKENTKLTPDTYLYTLANAELTEDIQLSQSVIESLQEIKNNSAVAGKSGTLDFIEIYYNCNLEDLSQSFKDLIKNKNLVRVANQVSNQYSVSGRPLAKGDIHMVYYIAKGQEAGAGEKIVIANQLKSIIGNVRNYQIFTIGGMPVDMFFSKLSVENRVVNSAYIMGGANLLLEKERDLVVDMWKNR